MGSLTGRTGSPFVWILALCLGAILPVFAGSVVVEEDAAVQKFDALIKGGHYTEAAPELEAYTKEHPDSWLAFYQLGYVCFRLHRIQDSARALSRSLALNSQYAEAHKILAYDLNIAGRQQLAIRELQQAIAIDPNSHESHYELGRIYFELGSYPLAVEEMEKARALKPDFVRVWHNLGLAYNATGDSAKAVECFEKALVLNSAQQPQSAWPYIDYATWYNLQNDFENARRLLVTAVQIDGRFDQAFEELGKAYRGLGDFEKAIDSYQKAVALNPRKAEYHYALAQLYRLIHRPEDALLETGRFQQLKGAAPAAR
jgi:tetratricopeptide (TPR) repeat protein